MPGSTCTCTGVEKQVHMLYCSDFLTRRWVKFRAFTEELAWRDGWSQQLSWPMNWEVYALPTLSHTQSAGNHCNTVLVQQKKLLFHWKCSGRHKCTPAMSPTPVHHRGCCCFLSTQMSSRRSMPLNDCCTVQRPNKVFQTINLSSLPGMKTGINEL